MNVALTDELKDFVQSKIRDGQYPTAEAVIVAALNRFRDQDDNRKPMATLDDFVDHEFVEYCANEADDAVTMDEVLDATAAIKDSMARVIIEDERADRF